MKGDRFLYSLLGCAVGDALGYQVEFMKWPEIKKSFGAQGVRGFADPEGIGLISDDTQMTLFTANGLRWAASRILDRGIGDWIGSGIKPAYMRWLYTQGCRFEIDESFLKRQNFEQDDAFFIMDQKALFESRSPGATCITSLVYGTGRNDSKGCGANMRVAPIGLVFYFVPEIAYSVAADSARLTHGHPTAAAAAGATAMIIAYCTDGYTLTYAVHRTLEYLKHQPGSKEVIGALLTATQLAESDVPRRKAIRQIGGGWTAEKALAIAVYAAQKEGDPAEAILTAVNHSGDSDSTGAICGSIVGAVHGEHALRPEWIEHVELSEYIADTADKLYQLSNRLQDLR